MKKKIAFLTASLAALAVAVPAFAWYTPNTCGCGFSFKKTTCCPEVSVTNSNFAYVENDVDADAKLGGNEIEDTTGDAKIETGDSTAIADSKTDANYNQTVVTQPKLGKVTVKNTNGAMVTNDVDADAKNGGNEIEDTGAKSMPTRHHHYSKPAPSTGTASIKTGSAGAQATSLTVVNQNITEVK